MSFFLYTPDKPNSILFSRSLFASDQFEQVADWLASTQASHVSRRMYKFETEKYGYEYDHEIIFESVNDILNFKLTFV